jgi:hypothetical protein
LIGGIVLFCGVTGLHAQSQATTGVIEGTVEDETGAALPGVTVILTNTATNFQKVVVTDGNGRFRGLLLPLGPYTVTAGLEGFATLVREGLDLALGQAVNLEFTLGVSATQEEITVTGEASLIETTRSESQVRIGDAEIEGLPNNGRNFLEFSKLTPGVAVVQGPDGDELSINGQKGINNNISVDGADFNNPFFGEQRGGQRPPFTFNIDAVKEVLIVTDGAPAEYGRSSGGFVNVVTKSGTNDFKGSVHAFYKDDSLSDDPVNRDGTTDPKVFDQTQVGFTIGGPLKKDEVFFFAAYDLQAGEATKQNNPDRLDSRLVDFFNSIGAPDENGPITRTDDADVALAKIDWQASDKNLVTLRSTYTFSEQRNGTFDVDVWGRSANGIEQDWSHSATGTVISTLSDSLLNEFRGQYAKEFRPRPYEGNGFADRPFPDTGIIENGNRFGMPFFLPVEYDDDRIQINNNLSILKGNHSMKAGIEYNDVGSSQTFIGFANGRFIFDDTEGFLNYVRNPLYVTCSDGSTSETGFCSGDALVTGPVNLYLQFAGVGGLTAEQAGTQTLEQEEIAVFFQDQWQPSANLTLDFGLRVEEIGQPDPITPPSEVFYSEFIGQTVTTEAGPQEFPGDGTIPDDTTVQPRFALAWSPPNKPGSILRANAGIYAARIPALTFAGSRNNTGSVGQTLARLSFLGPGGFGVLPQPPPWDTLIPASEVGSPFQPDVTVTSKDLEVPKTVSASVSWETEIAPNYAWLIKGTVANTNHVTRFTNRNDPLLGSPWSTGLSEGLGINNLTVVESTAKSRFWGITTGINKRLSNGIQFQAYYTFSEDKSDDDNERDPFTFRYANITNLGPEFGLSDRHQENRFNGWLLWNAPYGIDVNIRGSYLDAQPADIGPDGVVGSSRCLPDGVCTLNGDVFQRNQGKKDNEFQVIDVRLSKDFQVGEWTFQPVLDVFNLLDETNFLIPETTGSLAENFDGTVRSGAGEPREIQIGIRLVKN